MKKIVVLFTIAMIMVIFCVGCSSNVEQGDKKLKVAVAIPPLKTFVMKVAGDNASIVTVIPPGNSPANYQPSPKEMVKISEADVYFSLKMPTEKANILKKISELNKGAKVIDLQEKVFTIYPSRHITEHEHEGEEDAHEEDIAIDPHVWLSPKRAVVIVEGIRDTLVKLDPDNKEMYMNNSKAYIKEIEELDKYIINEFKDEKNKTFIIFHPTYGYFADDYGLNMVSIELDGKEATAKGLENIIKLADEKKIKAVFYQEEFDSNQAEIIAKEIGGQPMKVSPLSLHYIDSLKETATKMKNIME